MIKGGVFFSWGLGRVSPRGIAVPEIHVHVHGLSDRTIGFDDEVEIAFPVLGGFLVRWAGVQLVVQRLRPFCGTNLSFAIVYLLR